MHTVILPVTIDPVRSAARRLDYSGNVAPHHFPRLREAVEEVEAISVDLSLRVDEQGLSVMEGTVVAQVSLLCQRCNTPYTHICEVDLAMTPARAQQALDESGSIGGYDPIELTDEREWHLHRLLEDEFLLSLPMVPNHPNRADCEFGDKPLVFGELPEEVVEQKPNPFGSLKHFKTSN